MTKITTELTTPLGLHYPRKGMEMITAELTTYPQVYTNQKGMGTILKQN